MVSKTAPSFALVVTGTFSEFLACITVVFLFARVKWSLNLHFRLRSYLLRILSVYYRRLLFFCWGKMHSKSAPCFALVVTGTFSEFLACITVVFLFCWGEMVSKTALSFAIVPSPNSKLVTSSFPFFCWGKMLSKTAPSFALVVTGTFSEFVACITVVFLFFSRVKWSLKLHFRLRSYLLRILSVYYRRLLFFCWGKMLSKTAP